MKHIVILASIPQILPTQYYVSLHHQYLIIIKMQSGQLQDLATVLLAMYLIMPYSTELLAICRRANVVQPAPVWGQAAEVGLCTPCSPLG